MEPFVANMQNVRLTSLWMNLVMEETLRLVIRSVVAFLMISKLVQIPFLAAKTILGDEVSYVQILGTLGLNFFICSFYNDFLKKLKLFFARILLSSYSNTKEV